MNASPGCSAPLALAPHLQTFLAIDLGQVRTGVAVGNRTFRSAQPLGTITAKADARFDPIAQHVQAWEAQALVIGVPYHPDGAAHEHTQRAQRFARQLRGRLRLPVFEVDERYSTTEALARAAPDVDAESACVILEQFWRTVL